MYVFALTLTLTIELLLAAAGSFRVTATSKSTWLLAVLGSNLVSHPMAWFLYTCGFAGFWPLEIAVVIFEAILIFKLTNQSFMHSFLFSLVANAISAGIGLVIF